MQYLVPPVHGSFPLSWADFKASPPARLLLRDSAVRLLSCAAAAAATYAAMRVFKLRAHRFTQLRHYVTYPVRSMCALLLWRAGECAAAAALYRVGFGAALYPSWQHMLVYVKNEATSYFGATTAANCATPLARSCVSHVLTELPINTRAVTAHAPYLLGGFTASQLFLIGYKRLDGTATAFATTEILEALTNTVCCYVASGTACAIGTRLLPSGMLSILACGFIGDLVGGFTGGLLITFLAPGMIEVLPEEEHILVKQELDADEGVVEVLKKMTLEQAQEMGTKVIDYVHSPRPTNSSRVRALLFGAMMERWGVDTEYARFALIPSYQTTDDVLDVLINEWSSAEPIFPPNVDKGPWESVQRYAAYKDLVVYRAIYSYAKVLPSFTGAQVDLQGMSLDSLLAYVGSDEVVPPAPM